MKKCEICNKEIPDGYRLCRKHWMEEEEKNKKQKKYTFKSEGERKKNFRFFKSFKSWQNIESYNKY